MVKAYLDSIIQYQSSFVFKQSGKTMPLWPISPCFQNSTWQYLELYIIYTRWRVWFWALMVSVFLERKWWSRNQPNMFTFTELILKALALTDSDIKSTKERGLTMFEKYSRIIDLTEYNVVIISFRCFYIFIPFWYENIATLVCPYFSSTPTTVTRNKMNYNR